MSICRDCGHSTSRDCGKHGPTVIPCPGCGYAGSDWHVCPPGSRIPEVEALRAELAAERKRTAEHEARAAAEEEICTDDAGQPLVCAECHEPLRAGEGGWAVFSDGVRHAHACEARYYQRELAAEREKRALEDR